MKIEDIEAEVKEKGQIVVSKTFLARRDFFWSRFWGNRDNKREQLEEFCRRHGMIATLTPVGDLWIRKGELPI